MGVRLLVRSCWASRTDGDAVYEFDQARILVGRGRGADVRLPHRAVSVRHATIEHGPRGYSIVDHGTTNGTYVSGARIVPGRPKPLRDGDRIEIGGFSLVMKVGVPILRSTSSERTASLARRLAREASGEVDPRLRPVLTVVNGPQEGAQLELPDPPSRVVLGRGEECDLVLADADASREHAEIEVGLDGVWVRDLESKNGIAVGDRATKEKLLSDRDEIRVGNTVVRFEDPARERVEALEGLEDEEVRAPSWADVAPAKEPEAPAPEAPSETGPEPVESPDVDREAARKPPPPGRAPIAAADLVIYVLASVVFALSVLGLVWLLRSG
jgi:pSer/pThr/pTyr-binding forkhead associated (FHA) protein